MAMKTKPPVQLDDLSPSAYITLQDTARLLSISEISVRRWSAKKMLPPIRKIGSNSVRMNVGELRAALAKLAA